MKLLLIHPGASYSTADVFNGYRRALIAAGHEIVEYALDGRIPVAGDYLRRAWKHKLKTEPDFPKPTPGDVMYRASAEALERALWFGVDGAIVFTSMYFHPRMYLLFRRAHVPTAAIFTESPYDDEPQLKITPLIDAVFTNERATLHKYQAVNPHAYYLPHAYDPAQIEMAALCEDVPAHDVVFVGTGFQERIDLLSAVDWTGIDFGLYGHWNDTLGSRHRLRKYLRGGVVDNHRTIALYQKAKIGLNLYRESIGFGKTAPRIAPDEAESLNPRTYEMAAAGCFQVSSDRAETDDIFGSSILSYVDSANLEEMIRYYLNDDPVERTLRAVRAVACVDGHTYDVRAAFVTARLEEVWKGRAPPGTASAEEGTSGSGNAVLSVVR